MDASEIRNYSEDWYTLGKNYLPEFGTPQFARIAGASNSFSYKVAPGTEDITVRLTNKVDTAYVDLNTKTIYISAKYFNEELYTSRYGDDATPIENFAIALINGSVIHEALHIRHTESRGDGTILGIMASSHRYHEMIAKFGKQVCAAAFNIVEDLYIEAQVDGNLATWLQACSDILFPVSALDDINLDLTEIGDYLNLAVVFKNKELRSEPQFDAFSAESKMILERVSSGSTMSQHRRVELAFDFLNEFEMPESESSDEEEAGESDESEPSESESGEGESAESESADGEAGESEDGEKTPSPAKSELGEGDVPASVKEMLDELEEMAEEEVERIAEEIREASDEVAKEESTTEDFSFRGTKISWKKLVEKDVMKAPTSAYATAKPTTKINFGFLKELQAIRTLNRTPGQARNRGSVMVKSRLTRIATDGKIFAKRDAERQTLKRIEVIINVDFSGSTGGSVINNELGSAIEMSKVLRSAGIAHSVYGHTSTGRSYSPYLVHIYSYDMEETNHDMDERFKRACYIRLSENFDGVVINRLGEKFTGKRATRYIVNLSDGSPAGPGYHGTPANAHTKSEIDKLRKVGIGVFAISVVEHVVNQNNRIYGEQFNIDGSRNTAAQFRALIKRMVS